MALATPQAGTPPSLIVSEGPLHTEKAFRTGSSESLPRRLELLSPAGDRACAEAAVENGANAVYFGLAGSTAFNARARAVNIAAEELADVMAYLHRRGVKGYVTLNTLVFPNELAQVQSRLVAAALSGVDAVIVQDLGVARLAKAVCPELPLHASTQMSLTCAESIRAAAALGIERVILPREFSLDEVAHVRRDTTLELECFVHGALCIAYSGQCLASESLGGRSANRGQCAQACRMPYGWVCRGDETAGATPAGAKPSPSARPYLLSPNDLAAFGLVAELQAAGVDALKIEGRLKSPEYVAQTTQLYRRAIDAAASGRPLDISAKEVEELQLGFSRGFSHGWLKSRSPDAPLVPGDYSAKRGVLIGHVAGVAGQRVAVRLCGSVQRGDGVVFEADRAAGNEQGGRVFEVFQGRRSLTEPVASGTVELTFRHGGLDLTALPSGQRVWKTDDPQLDRRLRRLAKADDPRRTLPVDLAVDAAEGQPLRIAATATSGAACRIESPEPLQQATKHPLSLDLLREQFGRLGGSGYQLRHVEARIVGRPMAPLSVLGKMRRALVEGLDASAGDAQPRRTPADPPPLEAMQAAAQREPSAPGSESCATASHEAVSSGDSHCLRASSGTPAPASGGTRTPRLYVLCRSLEQVQVALDCGPDGVVADFRDLCDYAEAVRLGRSAGIAVSLATPRILKPGEADALADIARCRPDGVLVRNLAAVAAFRAQGTPMVADFSLNAANELSVAWLLEQGVSRVTASFDLDGRQCLDLLAGVPPHRLELVVHQHMPMFYMEHCPFAAELSPGATQHNCGQPCRSHAVRLRDHAGAEHALRAEFGCRTTVYNAAAQSGAEFVPRWIAAGARHFRIDLLDEMDAPGTLVAVYRELLVGRIEGAEAWSRLRATIGSLTRGSLEPR